MNWGFNAPPTPDNSNPGFRNFLMQILTVKNRPVCVLRCRVIVCQCPSVCVFVCLDPPHFTCRPRPIYQRLPVQSVIMPCCAEGDPMPVITWRKVTATPVSNVIWQALNLTSEMLRCGDWYLECDDQQLQTWSTSMVSVPAQCAHSFQLLLHS